MTERSFHDSLSAISSLPFIPQTIAYQGVLTRALWFGITAGDGSLSSRPDTAEPLVLVGKWNRPTLREISERFREERLEGRWYYPTIRLREFIAEASESAYDLSPLLPTNAATEALWKIRGMKNGETDERR